LAASPKAGLASAVRVGGMAGFSATPMAGAARPSNSLYIDGMPADMDEAQVKLIFEAYGTLKAAKRINQTLWMLNFETLEDAQWLEENLNENIPQGMSVVVKVRFAQLGPAQPQGLGFAGGTAGGFRASPYGGAPAGQGMGMGKGMGKGGGCFGGVDIIAVKRAIVNANILPGGRWKNDDKTVMVKNLPPNTSDKDIYDLFSCFGAIYGEGVRALISEQGQCKGTAFVNYLQKESSIAAVQTLNGFVMPNGTPLTVMLSELGDARQGGGMKGDWNCPSCGDLNFARNKQCRKCGTPNPDPTEFEGTFTAGPGDWTCPNCGDFNFARNAACRKCGTPNPDPSSAQASGFAKQSMPGDWNCPNCGDLNFARNSSCRKCGTPNPSPTGGFPKSAGDWNCPNCNDLNFARNMACRKCGTPNPSPTGGVFPQSAGDWNCPNCGDLNFARNIACRKCGTPKPM